MADANALRKIIILKNVSVSDITVAGALIPAGQQGDFSEVPISDLFDDPFLEPAIASGDIIVNDGTGDLSADGGDIHIRRDSQHTRWVTPWTDEDGQIYDDPLPTEHLVLISTGTNTNPVWDWPRLRIRDDGVIVPGLTGPGTPMDMLDFTGSGVTVTHLGGGIAGIDIAGPGLVIQEEGGTVTGGPHDTLNFVGASVTVTDGTGGVATITLDAENNTASNIGVGGVGVFDGKVGVDLQFKNINAGSSKVSITDDSGNNEIDIDVDPSNILTSTLNNDENWADDQNLWLTVAGDSGSTAANTTTDTLTIAGGTNISTLMAGDTLIINTTAMPDQNLFSHIVADSGSTTADVTTDTLNIVGGTNVTTTIVGDTLTIDATGGGSGEVNTASNIGVGGFGVFDGKVGVDLQFKNINTGSNKVSITDDVGNNEIDIDIVPGNILTSTLNNNANWAANQNLFETVTADSGSTTANVTTDTLNIVGGTNVTTTIVGDTLTIDATGGGAGESNTASNVGAGGVGVFDGKVGLDLQFKNINAGSNKVTITDDAGNNEIDIDVDPSNILTSTLNNDENWAANQNIWLTIAGDSGSSAANTITDTLTVSGGTGIDTLVSGDTLTITNSNPNVDQNIFLNVTDGSNTAVADSTTDTLTIAGGSGIDVLVNPGTDTVTISYSGVIGDLDQNLFETVSSDSGSTTANTITDTITIAGGTGIDTSVLGDTLTITANANVPANQNLFETIALSGNTTGDTSVVADTTTDTLNIVGGTGVTLTGNATTDTITISTDGQPDQNLFETITGDSGSTTANVTNDTLTIAGGTGIDTVVSGDTLTITANNAVPANQNIWLNVAGDSGSTAANTTTDTLTVSGGTLVTTSVSGDTLTIDASVALNDISDVDLTGLSNNDILIYNLSSGNWEVGTLPAPGETNTASNIGVGGVGVFDGKVGVDLQFKNINAGSNKVTVTDDAGNNEIDIDVDPSNILTSTLNNDENWASNQNVFVTVNADSGTTTADTITDTFIISGGSGISTSISGDTLTITNTVSHLLNKLDGIVPPTVNDDSGDGYEVGSFWVDTVADEAYRLVDDTVGAAVWINTTLETSELATVAVSGDHLDLINIGTNSHAQIDSHIANVTTNPHNVTAIQVGAAATASNVGVGGVGVFKQKTGTDLEFRNVNAGSNKVTISLDAGNNEIDVDIDPSNILTSTLNNDSNWAADQNLWLTVVGDSGSSAANATTDTLNIVGGSGISTAMSGDTLTISNSSANADQDIWLTIASDSGSTAANTTTDTLTIAGGTGISTAVSGDTLTITNDSPNDDQNIWLTVVGDSGATSADTTTDTLNVVGGSGISTSVSGDTLTINATGMSGTEMPTAQLTKTGSVYVTSTSHTDVVFDTIDVENDDTVLDIDPDLTHIDVLEDGLYFIGYSMDVDSGSNATTLSVHLRDVGITPIVDIPGTVRTYADAEHGILAASSFVYLDAGSRLEIEAKRIGSNTPTIVNPTMYAMKVEGAKGDQGPAGSGSSILVKDEGTNVVNTPHDALNFVGPSVTVTDGGSGVATVTISATPDQDLFKTVATDSGSSVADNSTDTLTLNGGSGISTSASGDTITITNDSPNIVQDVFKTVSSDSGSSVADNSTDTLTITGGSGISTSASGDTITISNTSPNIVQDVFKTIVVSGQSNVVAESSADTLTLVAGTNMTITTDAGSDTVTFAASGGAAYGAGFEESSSDSESSTTSSYKQTKLSHTTASLTSGHKYRIGYSFECKNSSDSGKVLVDVEIDGTDIGNTYYQPGEDCSNNYIMQSGFYYSDSLSGAETITIKFSNSGYGTAYIKKARIEIWRVS